MNPLNFFSSKGTEENGRSWNPAIFGGGGAGIRNAMSYKRLGPYTWTHLS